MKNKILFEVECVKAVGALKPGRKLHVIAETDTHYVFAEYSGFWLKSCFAKKVMRPSEAKPQVIVITNYIVIL